jgi:hypothetical protein
LLRVLLIERARTMTIAVDVAARLIFGTIWRRH